MASLSYPATEMTSDQDPEGFDRDFPTRIVLDRIGDRWTVLIVGALDDGPHRFSQLAARVDGISQKMLAQTLRSLERDGFVTRTVYPEVPPRVEYELTALGRSLQQPLRALEDWAVENMTAVAAFNDGFAEARAS